MREKRMGRIVETQDHTELLRRGRQSTGAFIDKDGYDPS